MLAWLGGEQSGYSTNSIHGICCQGSGTVFAGGPFEALLADCVGGNARRETGPQSYKVVLLEGGRPS